MNFYPCNRHLLVEKAELEAAEGECPSAVLLPDDYKPKTDTYGAYKLLLDANDCSLEADPGDTIIAEQSMVKEVEHEGKKYFLVQENYVLGIFSEE